MIKYGLIVENNKELKDFVEILNKLSLDRDIYVKIVLLSDVYKDKSQLLTLENIKFSYDVLSIRNKHEFSFVHLSLIEKIKIVLLNKREMFNFMKDVDIVLSGVQTIFERVLYSGFKKSVLKNTTPFVVYHRHLLFDDGVGTKKSWKSSRFIKFIMSILGLDGFFIDTKAVGFADYYIVLGEINKQYLVSKNISPDIIYPLGSLEYDNLAFLKQNVQRKTIVEKKSVCYITGACEWIGDLEGEKYQYKKIVDFCEYFKDRLDLYDVWIRVHPREPISKYESLQKKYPFLHLQVMSDNPLLVDIDKFDILIGGTSTILFEAGLLDDKKIIFFILEEELYRYAVLLKEHDIVYIDKIENFEDKSNSSQDMMKIGAISYRDNEKALARIVRFIEKL